MELTLRRTMTRRRNVQVALAEVVLTTALGKPEDLMDPILRFIDALLEDEQLVDRVHQMLRRRRLDAVEHGGREARRISRLKHPFGMARSRYKGEIATMRTALWAGIASNLVPIASKMAGGRS